MIIYEAAITTIPPPPRLKFNIRAPSFLLLFILFFTFYSCQKDEFVDSTSNSNTVDRFQVETVSGKQIKDHHSLQKIFSGFGSINKDKSTTHKGVYNHENNFSIDTTFGILIKDIEKNLYSYNFKITRDTIQNNVENLVIVFDATNQYQAFMVDYGFTKKDYESYNKNTMPISEHVVIKPIHFNIDELDIDLASKCTGTTYECYESYGWAMDDPGTHGQVVGADEHEHWTSGWVLTGISCGYVSCSGGSESGDFYVPGSGDSGGGGGSSNGGDDNDFDPTDPNNHGNGGFVSAPVIDLGPEKDENFEDNCEDLHAMSTAATLQNEFATMESNVGANKEKGYAITAVPFEPLFTSQYMEANDGDLTIRVTLTPNVFAIMHVHTEGGSAQPMFGWGDIKTLYDLHHNFSTNFDYPHNDSLFTVFMTVQGYTYAIKISDPEKLGKLGDIFSSQKGRTKFKVKLDKAYRDASNDPYDTSPTQTELAKAFLKFINSTYDLGISLYRTDNDGINYDPQLPLSEQKSYWQQLSLNEDNNLVTTNCTEIDKN